MHSHKPRHLAAGISAHLCRKSCAKTVISCKYLMAQIVFSLSGMATGFLIVYTAKTWNLPDSQAGGICDRHAGRAGHIATCFLASWPTVKVIN